MINKIDISNIDEESYILDEKRGLEILFNEEGFFIFSSEGIFSSENFSNCVKKSETCYILINEDKDQIELDEIDYKVIKELYTEKCKNINE
jgi:hypothetical protein